MIDDTPQQAPEDTNHRETGGRVLKARPDLTNPDPLHDGDRGDKPKRPYGLTESLDDRGDATRHHDGTAVRTPDGKAAR